jgi:ribosomal protein S10
MAVKTSEMERRFKRIVAIIDAPSKVDQQLQHIQVPSSCSMVDWRVPELLNM